MRHPSILINHLSYSILNTAVAFEGLCFSLGQSRYGMIGDNGVGKTTLLKLMAGILQPQQGSIQRHGNLLYCPQHYVPYSVNETIAETLGIAEKLKALNRITNGDFMENDNEIIGDDWNLQMQVQQLLQEFDLEDLTLDRAFLSLSGGQQTKCLLLKVLLSKADFILLDEPTNNLDLDSRKKLYDWVKHTKQGLIIVSHDRTLLNNVNEILEITSKGLHRYGGNFDFFQEQKAIQQAALQQDLAEAKRQIKKTERSIQQTREKHERRKKQGKSKFKDQNDTLLANYKNEKSEQTQSRNKTQAEQMLTKAQENLSLAQSQIEIKESIHANLDATIVPNGKMVLDIENMSFAFPAQKKLFDCFNLKIVGPERLALKGKNGSGKTSLIRLILNELQPSQGGIKIGVSSMAYLDQHVSFLQEEKTLIDIMQLWNPDLSTFDAYSRLASFNFRNKDSEKKAKNLSGGERIRAGLAIRLLSKAPPQLIILDEPTNHLDIRSQKAIENAINAYKGALIVISHDQHFLKNISIQREVSLPHGKRLLSLHSS